MPSISINSAEQVVRPPPDGLPFLRANRASELSTEAGALSANDGLISAFEADSAAAVQMSRTIPPEVLLWKKSLNVSVIPV